MSKRVSYADVVGTLAIFIALGGTGYAVTQLPSSSVGTKQLKRNAVTSAKVDDRSLRQRDLARGVLREGPPGPAGSAKAYVHVNPDGSVVTADSKGNPIVQRVAVGRYCIGVFVGRDAAARTASPVLAPPVNVVVTPIGDEAVASVAVATDRASIDAHCANATSAGAALVTIADSVTGAPMDSGFYAAFN